MQQREECPTQLRGAGRARGAAPLRGRWAPRRPGGPRAPSGPPPPTRGDTITEGPAITHISKCSLGRSTAVAPAHISNQLSDPDLHQHPPGPSLLIISP